MFCRGDSQKGFTLVEILVVLFIMGIVTSALYKMYQQNSRTWTCQNIVSDVQQSARVAMDVVSRDLTILGFDIRKSAGGTSYNAIDSANTNSISFQYRNDSLDTADKHRRYTYSVKASDKTLRRESEPWDSSSGYGSLPSTGSGYAVAEYIKSFTLLYYDGSGNQITNLPLTPTSTPKSSNDIRLIKVIIETESSLTCPLDNEKKSIKLSTEIRPRNLGIGSAAEDTTPPACPANFVIADPLICGKLNLSWDASAAVDTAGYVIYYGQSSGTSYPSKVDVGNTTSKTLTGLTVGNTYYARVVAYDNSGNESILSGCTEQNKSLSIDSPGTPVSLDATASDTELTPKVFLTWTSNDVNYSTNAAHSGGIGPDTDVTKYEIWRQAHSGGSWAKVADAGGASTNSYTNTLNESEKCTTFDYRIRAVTSCDGTADLNSAFSDVIYGDGSGTIIDPDIPTDDTTNTTPRDNAPPSSPSGPGAGGSVLSKAGYRRTFMNWDNPSEGDLDSVSIRYNKADGSTPPYPATLSEGTGVENGSTGIFDASPGAAGQAYTHYGPSGCVTDPACLDDGYTYSYSLFAIDTCGNASDAAETAQTTIGQCGEEEAGPSAGPPSTPQNFTVEACNTYTFKWDRINDTYPSGEYDLAGFYLYRSTDGGTTYSKADPNIILNPPSARVSRSELGTAPDLNSAYTGKIYKYKVYSIDCIRETQYSQNPTASTAAPDPAFTGGVASDVLTVTPGRVTFANNTGAIITGDITAPTGNPDHSAMVKNFYHNSVKLNIENTSFGVVRWDSARISWTYSDEAFLKAIYRTDTSPEQRIWNSATPVSSGSTITIGTNFRVDGSTSAPNTTVPLRFIFTDTIGNVSASQDMRGDSLTFSNIGFTRIFSRNDGSGDLELPSSCVDTTITETVNIPQKPSLGATIQDKPTGSQIVWVVPTESGGQSAGQIDEVNGTSVVNVYTNVNLDTGASISSLKLYYGVTDKTAADPSGVAAWTALDMYQDAGTQYTLYKEGGDDNRIPANADQRVWFYIVLVDSNGNFDRHPEITSGYFTYDQKEINPCLDKPDPPTDLNGVTAGNTQVDLSWTAPTLNTDGSAITDTISYDLYRSSTGVGGPFSAITTDLSLTAFSDTSLDLASNQYAYKIKAKDDCASTPNFSGGSGPNYSDDSNIWMECVGAGISITPDPASISPGDTISLTVADCSMINGASDDTITAGVTTIGPYKDDDTFTMVESGDSGSFTINDSGRTDIITSTTPGCTPEQVCLWLGDGTSDAGTADTVRFSYGGNTADVTVNVDPCLAAPDPGSPTATSAVAAGNWAADIQWTEPANKVAAGVTHYALQYKLNAGGTWTNVPGTVAVGITTARVSFDGGVANLSGNTGGAKIVKDNMVFFRLKAVNSSCSKESAYSNEVNE